MRYFSFIIVIIFLCLQIAFGGTRHSSVNDNNLLNNAKNYDCIVQVVVNKNGGEYKASGVLISKDIVLTSAHIVYQQSADNISIIYHNKKYKVTKSIVHNNFQYKFDGDLAILKILGFIDTIYPKLYETKDEIGKLAYLGGYGAIGTGDTGYNSYDFKLRVGSNIVEYISGDMLMCTLSKDIITKYEFITCPGDSGGGLFINGKLAGINSSLFSTSSKDKPLGKYDNSSGHTRISQYIDWIKDNI